VALKSNLRASFSGFHTAVEIGFNLLSHFISGYQKVRDKGCLLDLILGNRVDCLQINPEASSSGLQRAIETGLGLLSKFGSGCQKVSDNWLPSDRTVLCLCMSGCHKLKDNGSVQIQTCATSFGTSALISDKFC
jgi:hypothetical protein